VELQDTDYSGGLLDLLGEFYDSDLPINNSSRALETGRLVIGGQAYLLSFAVLNTNAAAQYIQLHDVSQAPTSGAIPVMVFTAGGTSNLVVAYTMPGRRFHQGIYITNSSTAATFTVGSADCYFDVQTIPAQLIG